MTTKPPKSTREAGGQRPPDHVPNRTEGDMKKAAPAPDKGESSATNPGSGQAKGSAGAEQNRNHPKKVEHPGTSTDPTPSDSGWKDQG